MKLKKEKKREWKLLEEAEKAINTLKRKLTASPILRLPDFNKEFEIKIDVSQYTIGGVLYQRDEKGDKYSI